MRFNIFKAGLYVLTSALQSDQNIWNAYRFRESHASMFRPLKNCVQPTAGGGRSADGAGARCLLGRRNEPAHL